LTLISKTGIEKEKLEATYMTVSGVVTKLWHTYTIGYCAVVSCFVFSKAGSPFMYNRRKNKQGAEMLQFGQCEKLRVIHICAI
jgi:hypothetical protein